MLELEAIHTNPMKKSKGWLLMVSGRRTINNPCIVGSRRTRATPL